MAEEEEEFLKAEMRKHSVVPTSYDIKYQDNRRTRILKSFATLIGVPESQLIRKTKTVIPRYVFDSGIQIKRPDYDYFSLVELAKTSWPVRRTFNAIIKESIKNWGHIESRFKFKCKKCEREYKTEVDKCECGAGKDKLREPKEEERKRLVALVKEPSRGRTFLEFVRTSIFYELACDDFYWSVIFDTSGISKRPRGKEVHNEHPGFIFPVGDRFGYLGGYDYYCPNCYGIGKFEGKDEPVINLKKFFKGNTEKPPKIIRCPECNGIMQQTYYVQEIGNQITARFNKLEIVHGSVSRLAPDLFGTPKMQTLVKLITTINATDDYELETSTEGKVGGLLGFPGLDQDKVTQILNNVKAERQALNKRDLVTGNLSSTKRTALIFVGLGEEGDKPIKIPFMDLADMELTLKFYQIYLNAIDEMYGVHSLTEVVNVKGTGTKELRQRVEVTKETAEEHQKTFSESFNEQLLPLCSIKDWIWVFEKLEPKDKLREAEIMHQMAATALTAANAGLKVKWTEEGLKISGEAKPQIKGKQEEHTDQPNEEPGVTPRRGAQGLIKPYEISQRTGQEITAMAKDLATKIQESYQEPAKEGTKN